MQYRTDKRTGTSLSALGFGCMRFPRDAGKTERLIMSAIENGVNYFDTAYIYPGSESVLGGILQKNKVREKIYLATKLPHQKCKSYSDFDKLFDIQLERLKTDYIDYYLIHNMANTAQWTALDEMGISRWIAEKKSEGKIRSIGFSFHGALDGFLGLLEAYDWDFCQIQYNYMDENYQAGVTGLRKASEKGLPVIIMEPLLGGKLATGLPERAVRLFNKVNPNRSAASWGLRWLFNQSEVTVVLSGMNAAGQLDDNIKTADETAPGSLTEEESAVYTPVVAVLRESYKIPCTGCNYCMPCPHGVNIPGCFAAYNTSYAIGYSAGLMQYIAGAGIHRRDNNGSAKNCKSCKACEKKCPQKIEISKELNSTAKRLEPLWMSLVMKIVRVFVS